MAGHCEHGTGPSISTKDGNSYPAEKLPNLEGWLYHIVSHPVNLGEKIWFIWMYRTVHITNWTDRIVWYCKYMGVCGGAACWGTALLARRMWVWSLMGSLGFFIDLILLATIQPWGQLSLKQKWVPGLSPGGNGGRCIGLTTLLPLCADCLRVLEASTSCSPKGQSWPI